MGGVTDVMDVSERCAGNEDIDDSDDVAWCFGAFSKVVGPL